MTNSKGVKLIINILKNLKDDVYVDLIVKQILKVNNFIALYSDDTSANTLIKIYCFNNRKLNINTIGFLVENKNCLKDAFLHERGNKVLFSCLSNLDDEVKQNKNEKLKEIFLEIFHLLPLLKKKPGYGEQSYNVWLLKFYNK